MVTRTILSSHPISYLKNEIRKQNIQGYSKLKKGEVVDLMLRHKPRFTHIKHNFNKKETLKKQTPKKEAPKSSMSAERKRELIEKDKARRLKASKPKTPVQPKKKRMVMTMIHPKKKLPAMGDERAKAEDAYFKRIEKEAREKDTSGRGKKLISNSPVKKSKEPKTINDYRTGRNYV